MVLRQKGRHNTAFTVNHTFIDVDWRNASAKVSLSSKRNNGTEKSDQQTQGVINGQQ
jgi:hypothetical protein